MPQSHWSRTAISGILGLAAIFLIHLTFPPAKNEVQGQLLPTKIVRTPIDPSQVTLLTEAPLTAESIGVIHLALHVPGEASEQDSQAILDKAKALAAKYGANGIITQGLPGVYGGGPLRAYFYQGQAIYVPKGTL